VTEAGPAEATAWVLLVPATFSVAGSLYLYCLVEVSSLGADSAADPVVVTILGADPDELPAEGSTLAERVSIPFFITFLMFFRTELPQGWGECPSCPSCGEEVVLMPAGCESSGRAEMSASLPLLDPVEGPVPVTGSTGLMVQLVSMDSKDSSKFLL
jgi:hypothetical protein